MKDILFPPPFLAMGALMGEDMPGLLLLQPF